MFNGRVQISVMVRMAWLGVETYRAGTTRFFWQVAVSFPAILLPEYNLNNHLVASRSSHQELPLTLAAPGHTPLLLPPTFLQGSGIIPPDWPLARQPRLTPQLAQISFTNGASLTPIRGL